MGAALLLLVATWWLFTSSKEAEAVLTARTLKGTLDVEVVTTGELEARNSVKIMGPGDAMRSVRIWETKINDLVPEGTVVKKGDYVASLDASSLDEKVKNTMDDLTKEQSEYTSTKLDTTLTMREQRDKLLNLKYVVEEKKIKVEQSAFEPPATIKQAQMELEKAQRELQQHEENYFIKQAQMAAKMQVAASKMAKTRRAYEMLKNLKKDYRIFAPEDGMVIYARDYRNNKRKAGENFHAYDPVVATLPDLTEMISRTYVNEVDVRKIKKGQEVGIGFDAFPDKRLTGKVVKVANVGEQKPNSDSKVYEVTILINESDSLLRPAMTTSNTISIKSYADCVYVPLEAIHSQGDTLNFLVVADGFDFVKKEVKVGDANDQYAVVTEGISEGVKVALNLTPAITRKPVQYLK